MLSSLPTDQATDLEGGTSQAGCVLALGLIRSHSIVSARICNSVNLTALLESRGFLASACYSNDVASRETDVSAHQIHVVRRQGILGMRVSRFCRLNTT